MEDSEYYSIERLEKSYWWYVSLHSLIKSTVQKNKQDGYLLDAGCGTGGMLSFLPKYQYKVGIDFSSLALKLCKKKFKKPLAQASIENLPFTNDSFSQIISLDVMYHMGVKSEANVLKEFSRILKPGGVVILNLPAFNFLKGSHDKAVHTRRRFNKSSLSSILDQQGFQIVKISYRNFFLFPLVLFKRFLSAENEKGSDLSELPGLINFIFGNILKLENFLLQFLNFPFGSSIYCVAKKP